MPIYEYKAINKGCEYCQKRFEVRQKMNEEPLKNCPKCGARVRRLISQPFICIEEPQSLKETFATHTEEEADQLGLDGGFAPDRIYED
jgi:putative FmdB family regulatory protein